MRAFIILGFLAATASASSIGYNYGPGLLSSNYGLGNGIVSVGGSRLIGTGGSALLGTGGSTLIGNGGATLIGNDGSGLLGSGGSTLIGGGGSTLIGNGYNSGLVSVGNGLINNAATSNVLSSGAPIVLGLDALDNVPQTVELSKQFFDFSAPEEEHDAGHVSQQVSNVLKKNLQVVFIKAPENNAATNAALQVAKQAIEQRTAIYVLSKENDAAQVIGTLQQIQENVPTTPEVRIIKYRTPADLAAARNTIQSQYENIGGSTEVINGGVAPVLNYASRNVLAGNVLTGNALGGSVLTGSTLGGNVLTGNALGGSVLTGSTLGGNVLAGNALSGSILSAPSVISTGSEYVSSGAVPLVGSTSLGGAIYKTGVSGGNYLPASPLKK